MGKYSGILFASDYDRTLTDPLSRIPQRNLDAIRAFMAQGGRFTVATGRSIPMFERHWARIPTNAPMILYNGAAVYDKKTCTLSQTVEIPNARAVAQDLLTRFPHLWMEVQGIEYHELFGENEMREGFYRNNDAPCRHTSVDSFPLPLLKFALYGAFRDESVAQFFGGTADEIRQLDDLQQYLAQQYPDLLAAERAAPRIVDIERAGVSKGAAARRLAESLGCDTLVCAGDALNDLSMLREADIAFVPADADPAVRLDGVHLTCACADGAIADAIGQLSALRG